MSADKNSPKSSTCASSVRLFATSQSVEQRGNIDIATMSFTPEANDIVIPVMSITGSGKTTFINTLVPHAGLIVGGDIESCTEEVQAAIVAHPKDSAHRVVFIDTPGLDSTTAPDENILHRIAEWLNRSYKKDRRLAGSIYLFEITQPRVRAPLVLQNLAYFDKLKMSF